MENVTMTPEQQQEQQQQQINLLDVPVTDEVVSLNIIVQFIGIANRRGAFSLAESAKIYECIKFFLPKQPPQEIVQESPEVGTEGEAPLQD